MPEEPYTGPIICACGHAIGEVVCKNNVYFLRAGGALAWALHGECAACGREFHYRAADRKLDRLVDSVKQMRSAGGDECGG